MTETFLFEQGLCFVAPNHLYVCDTSNHAVRLVDLTSGVVTTLAGNRRRGNDFEGGKTTDQVLASPWDICLGYSPGMWEQQTDKKFDVLYIAMAGTHQVRILALLAKKFQIVINIKKALITELKVDVQQLKYTLIDILLTFTLQVFGSKLITF